MWFTLILSVMFPFAFLFDGPLASIFVPLFVLAVFEVACESALDFACEVVPEVRFESAPKFALELAFAFAFAPESDFS